MTAVVVPVLDGAHVLPLSVPAVLALDGVDAWIWVDDGSTDGTPDILAAALASEPRARVVTLPENRGRGAARNAGVAATDADRIVFLDADVTPPRDLALAFGRALDSSSAVAAVGTFEPVPADPAEPYAVYLRTFARGVRAMAGERVPWKFFLTAAVGVDRAAFDAVGGFDEGVPYGEDLELAARLSVDHPHGLVHAEATVPMADVDPLDGALGRIRTFGRALPAMIERTPTVLGVSGLEPLMRPGAARTVARSRVLGRTVRAALPVLPERATALGVRYLLAHALALAIADAPSRPR